MFGKGKCLKLVLTKKIVVQLFEHVFKAQTGAICLPIYALRVAIQGDGKAKKKPSDRRNA